jgi:hypothetical protein
LDREREHRVAVTKPGYEERVVSLLHEARSQRVAEAADLIEVEIIDEVADKLGRGVVAGHDAVASQFGENGLSVFEPGRGGVDSIQ